MSHSSLRKKFIAGAIFLGWVLFFLSSGCTNEKEVIFNVDFEGKDFSQWRRSCGGCEYVLGDKQFVVANAKNSTGHAGAYYGVEKRNESASDYLPLNRDIVISWSLMLDDEFSEFSSGTVSQVIGYQLPCFKGGLFHLRYEKGLWGYWLRNIPAEHDYVSSIPVHKGQWIDFVMEAKFTHLEDGYIRLKIKESGVEHKFTLVEQGATFKNCTRGPYFKAGLYGHFKPDDVLFVDDVVAKQVGRMR